MTSSTVFKFDLKPEKAIIDGAAAFLMEHLFNKRELSNTLQINSKFNHCSIKGTMAVFEKTYCDLKVNEKSDFIGALMMLLQLVRRPISVCLSEVYSFVISF